MTIYAKLLALSMLMAILLTGIWAPLAHAQSAGCKAALNDRNLAQVDVAAAIKGLEQPSQAHFQALERWGQAHEAFYQATLSDDDEESKSFEDQVKLAIAAVEKTRMADKAADEIFSQALEVFSKKDSLFQARCFPDR